MQTRRNTVPQQSNVPIPLAAMVVDLRNGKDDLLKTLRLEIENLAAEKQEQQVNHWQYLTDFIDFQALPPLNPEDVSDLWKRIEQDRTGAPPAEIAAPAPIDGSQGNGAVSDNQTGMMQWQEPYSVFNQQPEDKDTALPDTSMLTEEYQDCTHRIDLIRNKRHNALSDLGKTGRLGKNKKYARTHVIFITDSRDRDSLNSASAFAAYLKQYYRGHLEHSGYEDVLITTVVSMNHPNTAEAPRLLINNLRWAGKEDDWEHINRLIINEDYRADAGWQDADTQSYVTELLLYALLIIEPIDLYRIPHVALANSRVILDDQQAKERRELHPQTFIFGLSTVEHSTRWGRLYLNTALAAQTLLLLHAQGTDNRTDIEGRAQIWFDGWREDVRAAIPQDIPGDFPYRDALDAASKAARPAHEIFPERDTPRNIEQRSIAAMENYADDLLKTYKPLQQDQSQTIVHKLNELREKDESNQLVVALKRAQRVLGEFFSGATGSIARAKLQLEAISDVAAQYDKERRPLDFDKMRNDIEHLTSSRVQGFRDHCEGVPFLRAHPWLLNIVIGIVLLLCAFTGVVVALAAYAVFHHFAFAQFRGVASALDTSLLGISFLSVGNIILTAMVVSALMFAVSIPFRLLIGRGRHRQAPADQTRARAETAWVAEIILVGTLVIFSIFSFIVSAQLAYLADDPTVLAILGWLSGLPFWGWLALVAAIVCTVAETAHYVIWYNTLLHLREDIIGELRQQHERNLDLIKQHKADTVALDLLRRAGLTDGQGGRGPYHKRIVQLNTRLAELETECGEQLKLVSNRLLEPQVTLQFRKELLDVKELTARSQQLTDELTQESPAFREFAEVLLRVMGEETPADIEKVLRDERVAGAAQQFWRPSYLDRRTLRHLHVLTALIAAVTLRMMIDIPPTDAITALNRRLREISDIDAHYQVALESLIQRMQDHNKNVVLNSLRGQPVSQDDYEKQLVLQALTLWAQIFWMHQDSDLDDLLKPQDIFVVLKRLGYAPHTIRDILGVRVNPGGRPRLDGWKGDGSLIAPPSGDGFKYILSMDHRLKREVIYDSPDTERFIMLFLHRYPALPLIIPLDESDTPPALPMPASSALAAPNSVQELDATTQSVPDDEDVKVMATPINGGNAGAGSPITPPPPTS